MNKKAFLFLGAFFVLIFLNSFVSADTQTFSMTFTVPETDTSPPVITNLQNYTHEIYTPFSKDIDATDDTGVYCFYLNDTTVFDIDCSGVIANVTPLDTLTTYNLNLSVNDTLGYLAWEEFYIQVRTPTGTTTIVSTPACRYKKLVYYNPDLAWMKQSNCI